MVPPRGSEGSWRGLGYKEIKEYIVNGLGFGVNPWTLQTIRVLVWPIRLGGLHMGFKSLAFRDYHGLEKAYGAYGVV